MNSRHGDRWPLSTGPTQHYELSEKEKLTYFQSKLDVDVPKMVLVVDDDVTETADLVSLQLLRLEEAFLPETVALQVEVDDANLPQAGITNF